jgi:hypothetical protein
VRGGDLKSRQAEPSAVTPGQTTYSGLLAEVDPALARSVLCVVLALGLLNARKIELTSYQRPDLEEFVLRQSVSAERACPFRAESHSLVYFARFAQGWRDTSWLQTLEEIDPVNYPASGYLQ